MSVWTNFSGNITLRRGSGCSLGKMLKDIYYETVFSAFTQHHSSDNIHWYVEWSISLDGDDLNWYMKRVQGSLRNYDENFKMDLSVQTRFIC